MANVEKHLNAIHQIDTSQPAKSIKDVILDYLCGATLPLHHVESKAFKKFIKFLDPSRVLCGADALRRHLQDRHDIQDAKTRKRLEVIPQLSITGDIWKPI